MSRMHQMKIFNRTLIIVLITFCCAGCGGKGLVTDDDGLPASNYKSSGVSLWRSNGFTGKGSTVAVLDSGTTGVNVDYDVTDIEFFKYKYTSSQYWDDLEDDGYRQYDRDFDPTTHGDHMSQVVGSKVIKVGIAPDASIIHGIIASEGFTSAENIWKGLDWANKKGALVANLSFEFGGLFEFTGTDEEVISTGYAYKHDLTNRRISKDVVRSGMAIVHSSGNAGENMSDVVFITREAASIVYTPLKDSLIIVGALSEDLKSKADWSAFAGSNIAVQDRFLLAPGYNIVEGEEGELGTVVGTSPAAAHVSGAIAVMGSRWKSLTGKALVQIILDSANKAFAGYNTYHHGQGKLDLLAAYSPIGETKFKKATTGYIPLKAATIIMPVGFKELSFSAAFVDAYGRDFETTFVTQEGMYRSNFNKKIMNAMSGDNTLQVGSLKGASISVGQSLSGYDNYTNIVGFDGFTKEMFTNARHMQTVNIGLGDVSVGISTNLAEQINVSDNGLSGQGVSANIGYKNIKVSIYQSNEDSRDIFYGAKDRAAKGLKVAFQQDRFNLGVEMNEQSYQGNALVNAMNVESRAVSLGYDLIDDASSDFKFGVIGKYQVLNISVDMTLPKSNGDGSLSYKNEALGSSSMSVSKGIYVRDGSFNLSAYSDKHDNNVVLSYQSRF